MNFPPTSSINVLNLGKCFQVYENPKARLKQTLWRGRRQYYREFWALQDINFDLCKGESLGVIGRNGSGKSTLLQLICGTLTPTTGQVKANGRVAALLELGSGFNPEFTGRENVFLNASMLGLSEEKINARLDDILAFADIGDFVDQPVKAYSSGMSVRLAFAVIAYVNADILIVDEALSVGDVFFNQKCMRFINRFRENGTLLFVSHDPSAVTSLCDRALLLDRGKQISIGTPKQILNEYTRQLYTSNQVINNSDPNQANAKIKNENQNDESTWIDYRSALINSSEQANLLNITQFKDELLTRESFGSGKATIIDVKLVEAYAKQPLMCAYGGERVILQIDAKANQYIEKPIVGFLLKNAKGMTILGDSTLNSRQSLLGERPPSIDANDNYHTEFEFTLPMLQKGCYSLTIALAEGNQEDHDQLQWMNDALILESINNSIAAGLAGVPMHRIDFSIEKDRGQQK